MNGIMSYRETLAMERYLCPVCLRKLQSNIGFDVKKRYEDMAVVAEELGFQSQVDFFKAQLAKLS